jgi:nucleotide-binding universal stress UspA family protein
VSGSIVLGYDGSESANAALAETTRIAPGLGAKVDVVFAFYISPLGGLQEGSYREELEKVATQQLARAVDELEAAGVEVESHMVSGKPAEAILLVAERTGARMIVVGTVGEGAITGTILGSVVLKLVQSSPLPLLVVPTST